MKVEYSQQLKKKKTQSVKFYENTSSGCQVVPCGQTDMMMLMAAFCNLTIMSKKGENKFQVFRK